MRISDWSADVCSSDLLFYDEKLYCGLGFDGARFVTHQYGIERARPANPHGLKMRMRVTTDRHTITYDTRGHGGKTWIRFALGMQVSVYHHNFRGDFLMLRPGLYSSVVSEARFRNFPLTPLLSRHSLTALPPLST